MSVELTNHLWQSTLFAVLAGLLSIVLKRNSARVRYGLWLVASLKFLVPFALLMGIGQQLESVPAAQKFATQIPVPAASYTIQFTQPFLPASTAATALSHENQWVPGPLMSVWLLGFGSILYMRWRGWRRIRAAVRASIPLQMRSLDNVRASEDVLEPAVVGTVRPILLLPSGITNRLPSDQLQAVLAHELCHVRRRDNLTSSLHMIVEAVFWFHPLVWWIGSRLVVERERACDEEVLRLGNEPKTYAEGILNVCKFYQASPLACVSGVTGSDLKTRIEEILKNRAALKLSFGKLMLLATVAFAVLAGPVAVGVVHATSGREPAAKSITAVVGIVVREAAVPPTLPPAPRRLPRPSQPLLQPQAPDTFDVVSIRPAAPGQPGVGGARGAGGGARGGGPGTPTPCGGGVQLDPGRITIRNSTVYRAITLAYGKNCRAADSIGLIERLPDWVFKQAFDIEATFPPGTPAYTMMQLQNGEAPRLQTMLQNMLASRFNLVLHRSSKEAPLYNLVYVKGGKIIRSADQSPPPPLPVPTLPPQLPDPGAPPTAFPRGAFRINVDPPAGLVILQASSVPLSTLINIFQGQEGRFVADKTGLLGLYDIPEVTLNVGPFEIGPNAVSVWPEIMQQLGLKLESARGPVELLVIDRLDKPSQN